MRDPDRIDEMLGLIREIWVSNPDLRLGQLIVGATAPKQPCPEVFYIEDSELQKRLIELMEADTNKPTEQGVADQRTARRE